jgi:hypothetical protein
MSLTRLGVSGFRVGGSIVVASSDDEDLLRGELTPDVRGGGKGVVNAETVTAPLLINHIAAQNFIFFGIDRPI